MLVGRPVGNARDGVIGEFAPGVPNGDEGKGLALNCPGPGERRGRLAEGRLSSL